MGMERKDILDNEAEEKRQKEEEARSARLQALEDKARNEELARVKAEAELEAVRKMQTQANQGQTAQWTEEQWAQFEQTTGQTRAAFTANAQVAQQIFEARLGPLQKQLEEAEKRARKAEEKADSFEKKSGFEKDYDRFFKDKPALSAYKEKVDEFLSDYPEDMKNDPEKRKKLLAKAETYVRGVVGGKMSRQDGGTGRSANLREGTEDTGEGEEREIDFSGLESNSERRLISDIDRDIRESDTDGDLKKFSSSDGRGVRFDSADEFRSGDRLILQGGGKKRQTED